MIDDIWARDEIESPCIKICVIHPQERLCVGCHQDQFSFASIQCFCGYQTEKLHFYSF